jgi:hypothetical protein
MADFIILDMVLFDRLNKTALYYIIAVPLTHNNLPTDEAENIKEFENLVLEILNIWKLNSISMYPLAISAEGLVTINFL